VRAGQLGALEKAVCLLEHGVRDLFEAADTRQAVGRSAPADPRKARARKPPPSVAA